MKVRLIIMSKKEQKIFVIAMAGLVIFAFVYIPSSDSLFGSLIESFSGPNWDEISERNIVKNSIPINLIEEQGGKCKVTAEKFDIIVDHDYFIRGNELERELNYDRAEETLLVSCNLLKGEKSRLNIWYATEQAEKHSSKYQYFITFWEEEKG